MTEVIALKGCLTSQYSPTQDPHVVPSNDGGGLCSSALQNHKEDGLIGQKSHSDEDALPDSRVSSKGGAGQQPPNAGRLKL